jgi:hypothetical protein
MEELIGVRNDRENNNLLTCVMLSSVLHVHMAVVSVCRRLSTSVDVFVRTTHETVQGLLGSEMVAPDALSAELAAGNLIR